MALQPGDRVALDGYYRHRNRLVHPRYEQLRGTVVDSDTQYARVQWDGEGESWVELGGINVVETAAQVAAREGDT